MITKRSLPACLFAAALALPLLAQAAPQHGRDGGIAYVTGGIGLDERNALEAMAAQYSLEITNANPNGDYTTDNALTIEAKDGRQVLHLGSNGPLFYAQLPAGDYVVHATNSGQQQVHDIQVSNGKQTVLRLIWPQ
jgi:hypothetical protein